MAIGVRFHYADIRTVTRAVTLEYRTDDLEVNALLGGNGQHSHHPQLTPCHLRCVLLSLELTRMKKAIVTSCPFECAT